MFYFFNKLLPGFMAGRGWRGGDVKVSVVALVRTLLRDQSEKEVLQGEFHPSIHPAIRHNLVLGFSRLKPIINASTSCFMLTCFCSSFERNSMGRVLTPPCKSWRGNSLTNWRSSSQCQVSHRQAAGRRWNDYLRVWNDQQCLNSLHSSVPAVLHLWLEAWAFCLRTWRSEEDFGATRGATKSGWL